MVDNFDILIPFLKFESDDDFYYLQIMQRRKDNPESLEKNTVIIKNYYIRSIEYIAKKRQEIIDICNFFNARAGLRLNKRSYRKVAFRTLNNITAQMMQEDFHSAKTAFDNACGQCHNDNQKKWIVDIDSVAPKFNVDGLCDLINQLDPYEEKQKILAVVPTKSGIHLITTPFNMKVFSQIWPSMDVHKDNPTLLYCG